jgi:hypothetical protein
MRQAQTILTFRIIKVLGVVEEALQHSEVRFTRVLSLSGIETIEKARTSTGRGNRP